MQRNPFEQIRAELGLTRHDLAVLAGVSASTVYNAERGGSSTGRMLDALAALGFDREKLAAAYQEWRVYRRAALAEAGAHLRSVSTERAA